MKLETKRIKNSRNQWETLVNYNGKWLSFFELSRIKELADNNLTVALLRNRYRKGCYSLDQLLQKNSGHKLKKKKKSVSSKMIISLISQHDKKPGEILICFISMDQFKRLLEYPYWEYQRICYDPEEGGKYAFFIMRSEARDRGWIIR